MREAGFYWVRDTSIWVVAYWGTPWNGWWIHGDDGNFSDSDFAEIDERRIERPESK